MPGFQAAVRNHRITIVPRISPHPANVQVTYAGSGMGIMRGFGSGRGQWESVCFGAPRGQAMCSFEFHATVAQAAAAGRPLPQLPKLVVGFIQNIISGKRKAIYSTPTAAPIVTPEVFRVERDGSRIGAGLLDCGTPPPWFQNRTGDLFRSGADALHDSVRAFDNPRWEIPLALETQRTGRGVLKEVRIKDTFRLYAVAWDGVKYFPIAETDWGTDIRFEVAPGPISPGQPPRGTMTGQLVWANTAWTSAVDDNPIVNGTRVNEALIDTFVPR